MSQYKITELEDRDKYGYSESKWTHEVMQPLKIENGVSTMTYNLEVDYEVMSGLVRTILKEDYESLVAEYNRGKLHPEDHEFYKRMIPAFETIFEYYFTPEERKRIDGTYFI